jgi:hypothetical protein
VSQETKRPNRYNQSTNYLPAHPPVAARRITVEETRALEGMARPAAQAVEVAGVFTPQRSLQERTGPFERSLALVVRLLPFSAIWLVLAVGIVWGFNTSASAGFLIFAALTAVTYYLLSGQEYAHSGAGVERHRIDVAYALKMEEMAHQQELRRMALESTLKLMENASHERY